MENINSTKDLFLNVRKSIRLLYEFQKRMQDTMFHIKSILNLSSPGEISINQLYSNHHSRVSGRYGTFKLEKNTWAWDSILPMAVEYYLGEKNIGEYEFCLSVIQIIDNGYYLSKQKGNNPSPIDTYTYEPVENSETLVLFIMEIKYPNTNWAQRWDREKMKNNLPKWLHNPSTNIIDKTVAGNPFIIIKFPIDNLINEKGIDKTLEIINNTVFSASGINLI